MDTAAYAATQARVETIARQLLDTDPAALGELIAAAEHADALGPIVDPSAWVAGHCRLRMVIEHARALASARRAIVEAAARAGQAVPDAV